MARTGRDLVAEEEDDGESTSPPIEMALHHPVASSSRTTLDEQPPSMAARAAHGTTMAARARVPLAGGAGDNDEDDAHQLRPASAILQRARSHSTTSLGSLKGKEKASDDDDDVEHRRRLEAVAIQVPSSEERLDTSSNSTHGDEHSNHQHRSSAPPLIETSDEPHDNPWASTISSSSNNHGPGSTPTRPPLATLTGVAEPPSSSYGDALKSEIRPRSTLNTLTFSLASSTRPMLAKTNSASNTISVSATGLESNGSPADSSAGGHSTSNPNATTSGTGRGSGSATGTFSAWATTSWKMRSGKATMEQKRLKALGFDEELARDFDFWASAGLTICNIGGFPGTVLAVLTAMQTGGSSMYAIAWPISGLFMLSLAAVLGEMASTWPVAGAMFTWTFRLCRSSRRLDPWARYLSWIVGSFLLCSHVLLQIVITWQFAHNLLGTVALYANSSDSLWVTVSICWAVLLVSGLIVSSPVVRSPWFWRGCGFMTIVFFLTLNITLLTQAKSIRSAKWVFTNYENDTGFTSKSYIYMLGWVLTCVASGMEAAAHIAEDTRAPSRTVPLAMFWSVAATYIMGWISICVLMATLDATGLDPGLQPSIALIANSIPRAHTTLVLVFVLLSFAFQSVAQLLATSRFTWALARESALPFSDFLRRLTPSNRLPLSAIWTIIAIAVPAMFLTVIDMSIIATILLEGAGFSVMFSYTVPVLIYVFLPRDVLAGDGRVQWTLRKWSKPVAVAGTVFALIFMIMLCLPTAYPVTAVTASYASGVLVVVALLATLAWVFYGNARYAGPIKTTTRWTIGAEVELPRSATNHKTPTPAVAAGILSPNGHGGGGMTDSEAHGRTAHVFSSFPTQITERSERETRPGAGGETTMQTDWTTDWDDEDDEEMTHDDDDEDFDEFSRAGESVVPQRVGGHDAARWRSSRAAEGEGGRTPDEQV